MDLIRFIFACFGIVPNTIYFTSFLFQNIRTKYTPSRHKHPEVRQREEEKALAWPFKLEHTLIFSWRGMIWVMGMSLLLCPGKMFRQGN
jgi:hypothetical protein